MIKEMALIEAVQLNPSIALIYCDWLDEMGLLPNVIERDELQCILYSQRPPITPEIVDVDGITAIHLRPEVINEILTWTWHPWYLDETSVRLNRIRAALCRYIDTKRLIYANS